MNSHIVAIGGGQLKLRETLRLDKFIVGLTRKKNPRALFVPTASGDNQGYCETFDKIYAGNLGCRTDHLLLLSADQFPKRFKQKILAADIIYVGGGNTLKMMKLWRKLGINRLLKAAHRRGTILAGLSAGANCWHAWGHSDSQSFSNKADWSYIRVKGLGLVPGVFCPHLDAERRRLPFMKMISERGGIGIAADDNAAVWYQHGRPPTVITSSKNASVLVYRKKMGKVLVEVLHDGAELTQKNT